MISLLQDHWLFPISKHLCKFANKQLNREFIGTKPVYKATIGNCVPTLNSNSAQNRTHGRLHIGCCCCWVGIIIFFWKASNTQNHHQSQSGTREVERNYLLLSVEETTAEKNKQTTKPLLETDSCSSSSKAASRTTTVAQLQPTSQSSQPVFKVAYLELKCGTQVFIRDRSGGAIVCWCRGFVIEFSINISAHTGWTLSKRLIATVLLQQPECQHYRFAWHVWQRLHNSSREKKRRPGKRSRRMQQFFKRIQVRRAAVVERSSANGNCEQLEINCC